MEDAGVKGANLGRSQISAALNDSGYEYTEAEVRTVMSKLSEQGFIRSDRGRGGSKILEKGRRLLNELNGLKGF
jgi:repressor of nif and glnA expression